MSIILFLNCIVSLFALIQFAIVSPFDSARKEMPDISNEVAIDLGGKRMCRIASTNERTGRFTVEKLSDVRCLLVSTFDGDDTATSILSITCPSSSSQEASTMNACLSVSVNEDHYHLEVTEKCFSDAHTSDDAHCILCTIPTDDDDMALKFISHAKQKLDSHSWTCPVIVLAYRIDPKSEPSHQVMRALRDLARRPQAYKCLECTAVNKTLIRRSMALCLLAARPFLASVRSVEDLRFDDEVRNVKPRSRRSSITEKLQDKKKAHKMCHVQ